MGRLRAVGAFLALTLLTVGCAGDEPDVGRGEPDRVNQNLTVGYVTDAFRVSGRNPNLAEGLSVTETLLRLGPNFEVQPLLATSVEFRAPNTWRFRVRQGVTFHDGTPLNAEAVKVGLFDRVAAAGANTLGAGPGSAAVVDDFTVDFTPTTPNLRVPEQIVHPRFAVYGQIGSIGTKPIGTGPFRFLSYAPKDRLVVERYPGYWGPQPALEEITFRFFADDAARRLALAAGDVDLIVNVPRPDVAGVRTQGFDVATSAVGSYQALYANIHGDPPYDVLGDLRVRQAVASAIDREALVRDVLEGQGTTDVTYVPPGTLGQHASLVKGPKFDPARARSLLDQAGWTGSGTRTKDGRALMLTLVTTSSQATVAQYVQAQLKVVGIDVVISPEPDGAAYEVAVGERAGDLWLELGNQNDANAAFLPFLLFSSAGEGEEEVSYQALFAPRGRFDGLIASTLTEPDADKVRKATAEALHELIDNLSVVTPLAGLFRVYAMKDTVAGFEPGPSIVSLRWDTISRTAG